MSFFLFLGDGEEAIKSQKEGRDYLTLGNVGKNMDCVGSSIFLWKII